MAASFESVEVRFEDPVGGKSVLEKVSPADAERAQKDLAYAQALMEAALAQDKQSDEPGPGCSRDGADADVVSAFKWPHAAILLLVDTYRGYEGDLVGGKVSHKKAWERIASVLRTHGHEVTGPQCQTKFNGMRRTYKNIKDHNAKSGNGPRTWAYLEAMESLLGERPYMEPVALASSSSGGSRRRKAEEDVEDDASPAPPPKKRLGKKTEDLSSAILESRRIAEEGKERRHRERMAKQDALLAKLDDLLNKI
ncbi:trihelix transcription factor GTL1-like [Ischnura elegans]|uniref:trihelix transcription factor GTL1-like n=1 Tax=Ischnura elegans TaxID=197161 RepID=UPI001ED8755D|nr:trihelix transcription factor GTL1-like [Ischnura elegans]